MNTAVTMFRPEPALRQPPSSREAEQAVLGALMVLPEKFPEVADWLAADDFYFRDHRLIYAEIVERLATNGAADSVTLAEAFEANGTAEQVGGSSYLVELAGLHWQAANLKAYAEIVQEKSRLRQGIELGTRIANDCFAPAGKSAAEVLALAQSDLIRLAPDKRAVGPQAAKPLLKAWYEDLSRRAEAKAMPGLPTPWHDVNRITQGLQDGEVIVLAGRSNMGKSVLGMQLAAFAGLRETRTLLFSMEQTAPAVMNRCVSALADVPHDWLRKPNLEDDHHWARVTAAVPELTRAALLVDDSPRLSALQIRARAMREHLRKPIRLVVVDHLHEMALPSKQGEVIERADALRDLKALAKTLNCPVVVLAQLNRAATDTDRPQLKHLRGSGGIEEVADVVFFVHRPDYYDPADRPGLVELIIGKGRDIPTGNTINLRNRYDVMRADDWHGDVPQRSTPKGSWGRDRAAGGER